MRNQQKGGKKKERQKGTNGRKRWKGFWKVDIIFLSSFFVGIS